MKRDQKMQAKPERMWRGQTIHYLLTIATTGGCHVHAYLMTDDRRYVEHVTNEMIEEAEKRGLRVLPIVLSTRLRANGRGVVRGILSRKYPEAAECLRSATDFHQSVWIMPSGHPDNGQLLALH
jgi:hypothetical protein